MHPSRVTLERAENRENERKKKRERERASRCGDARGGKPRERRKRERAKERKRKTETEKERKRLGSERQLSYGRGAAYRGLENALFRLHSHRLRWVCREREMPAR